MRETRIRLFMQMELMTFKDKLDWLIRCCHYAVNNYPEEYCPWMPLPVPPAYINKTVERAEMAETGILSPTLTMIPKILYPLPDKQHPSIPPLSDIPPSSPLPLPSAAPASFAGGDLIKTEEKSRSTGP